MGKERGEQVRNWFVEHKKELILGSIPLSAAVSALLFASKGDRLSSRVCCLAIPISLLLIAVYFVGEKTSNPN